MDGTGKPRKMRMTVTGTVVSTKMKDTVTVVRKVTVMHPKYGKRMERRVKLHAHDPGNTCRVGDTVLVRACRPLSRTKRWRVVRILERAQDQRSQQQQ